MRGSEVGECVGSSVSAWEYVIDLELGVVVDGVAAEPAGVGLGCPDDLSEFGDFPSSVLASCAAMVVVGHALMVGRPVGAYEARQR